MLFFESLRRALASYAAGVHEAGPPASAAAIDKAARRLGALPAAYGDFLRSFDGALLFHELVTLYCSDDAGLCVVAPGQLRIGETPEGCLWMDAGGALRIVDEEEPDPVLCGTTLERWLAATIAREGLVVDRDGEFREVLDAEGALTEEVRRKRARLGRRHDPGAAIYLLEEAELLLGERREEEATARLREAVRLDPGAGPAWELIGALLRQEGPAGVTEAEEAALKAAMATPDPFLRASRLLDAALSGSERRLQHAAAAWEADPGHGARLVGEAEEALAAGRMEEAEGLGARLALLDAAPAGAPAALGEPLLALQQKLRTRQALRVL